MEIPLRLGPLNLEGYHIHRSGARWLCEPGQVCRAHQAIAFFNLTIEPVGGRTTGPTPFGDERELQVVCAPRVGGCLKFDSSSAPGGYLSVLGINRWDADTVLGHLEIDGAPDEAAGNAGQLRLMMLAGRRMTPLVDVHSGLLPGWNGRSRGWWNEGGETPVSLLSLGICDVTGVIMGEQCAFLEMFQAETSPTHFVFIPDHPIAPAAPVLLDQLVRSDAQIKAIAADLHTGLTKSGTPTANDWIFAGTMLSVMEHCPIRDTYDLFSPSGFMKSKPADAILLSLHSEPPATLRHKTLGYHLHILRHHQAAAGPVIRNWLASSFESVQRTTDLIKADYINLINAIQKATGARVIVLNRMSTSGDENISTYAPFDAPLSSTLANIASKELNLMLHDVADGRNVSIIDLDAIAADIGGGEHLPDGMHQSREMQEILRVEILNILDELRPQS